MPDEDQQRVIDYRDGPLLVLAGPGTGKTATVVELVADRVERHGLRPEQALVLTFSRRAADELRFRLASRLGMTVRGRLAWTFHAWCYAVLRAYDRAFAGSELRLMSGPEQDVVVRELLEPARGAMPSAGRRAGRRCWSCADLPMRYAICSPAARSAASIRWICERGEPAAKPSWQALAPFYRDYLDNPGSGGAVDYSGLVHRTAGLLSNPEVLGEVAGDLRLIVVDEYQDTDPAQELVLRALAATRAQLVVVGDPDQSIYGFRGADVSGILNFSERFRGPRRQRAQVLALGAAGVRVPSWSLPRARWRPGCRLPGLPARSGGPSPRRCTPLGPDPEGHPAIAVRVFSSPAQEAVAVADALRRAHLIDGLPWSRMAVLVRSTRLAGPLQRALADAGVPVETPADERPLTREPVLDPLLSLLHAGAGLRPLDEDTAVALLCSPLGGADALDLRRLRRALRERERAAGGSRRSGELLIECLRDPALAKSLACARGFG